MPDNASPKNTVRFQGAALVAAGILLSRTAGLVREIFFAHYFGNSDAADVFRAALRIPNFLQNLFGEGALSASFIPVYTGLRSRGMDDDAKVLAASVASLLALAVALLVLAGLLFTPELVDVITPGYQGSKRESVIVLVRILFPGAGILVLSAWCLGVLNSHRRFFLSYTAPVVWNAAIITALLIFGGAPDKFYLACAAAWASVAGSALQFLVQLPSAVKLAGPLMFGMNTGLAPVREVLRNFFPVVFSRGVVQVSAYVDSMLASLLPGGALAALGYAQMIYTLPISLFGMSVSAAELPEMSSIDQQQAEAAQAIRSRLAAGLARMAFFVVPTTLAFFAFGDLMIGGLYQSGAFTADDTVYVWAALVGFAGGLNAATFARLYSSAFYALRDTRTPLRFALLRVSTAALLGYFASVHLPPLLGMSAKWGLVGLTAASAAGAWLEYHLLRSSLARRIGRIPEAPRRGIWAASLAAALAAAAIRLTAADLPLRVCAVMTFAVFGAVYLLLCLRAGNPEAGVFWNAVRARSRSLIKR